MSLIRTIITPDPAMTADKVKLYISPFMLLPLFQFLHVTLPMKVYICLSSGPDDFVTVSANLFAVNAKS